MFIEVTSKIGTKAFLLPKQYCYVIAESEDSTYIGLISTDLYLEVIESYEEILKLLGN